jgi:hypothetical protein
MLAVLDEKENDRIVDHGCLLVACNLSFRVFCVDGLCSCLGVVNLVREVRSQFPSRFSHVRGQPQIEGAPFSGHRFQPHQASDLLGGLLDDGQPNAGAFIFPVRMKPLKDPENLLLVLRRDADAVVAHGNLDMVIPCRLTDDFDAFWMAVVELYGIGYQILKDLFQQGVVRVQGRQFWIDDNPHFGR